MSGSRRRWVIVAYLKRCSGIRLKNMRAKEKYHYGQAIARPRNNRVISGHEYTAKSKLASAVMFPVAWFSSWPENRQSRLRYSVTTLSLTLLITELYLNSGRDSFTHYFRSTIHYSLSSYLSALHEHYNKSK